MEKIKSFALKHPIIFSSIIFIFTSFIDEISKKPLIAFFSDYMDLRKATFLYFTVVQSFWAILMIPLIKYLGIFKTAGFTKPKQVWLCLPIVFLVLLSGWDIITGKIDYDTSDPSVFTIYFILNLSVGFVEEIMGRGLVLNLMMQKWGSTKKGIYQAVFLSSSLFGLIHLATVIGGRRDLIPGIGQVLYATFFGVFFAACILRNQSIWPMIFVHAFVDLIGCINGLTAHFGEVNKASALGTIIVVLFDLPVLLYGLFLLRKVKPSKTGSKERIIN